MNLCSDGHDEVCYEGKSCPACEIREDLQEIISGLETKITELEASYE